MLTNLQTFFIFLVVFLAMIANSFWESYMEGSNAWDKGKVGPKIKIGKYVLTGYHFFLFCVMWPLLLSLPLVIFGWNLQLFGVLVSAYFSGIVVEDFMWFVVNPVFPLNKFNSKNVTYYPWLKIGKFEVPLGYVVFGAISIFSWFLFWR